MVAFSICCIFQVKESIEKFISQKKATISELREQKTAGMPTVTVCNENPYKNEEILFNIQNGSYQTDNGIDEAWKNATFSISDLVKKIQYEQNGKEYDYTPITGGFEENGNDELEIKALSTLWKGMCYSFRLKKNLTATDFFYMWFNTGPHVKPKAIIHPEGQQLSVSTSTWSGNPYEVVLKNNAERAVTVTPQEYRISSTGGNCDPDVTKQEFYECFKDYLKSSLLSEKWAQVHCKPEMDRKFGNCTTPFVSFK